MRRLVALLLVPLLVSLPLCPWAVVSDVLAHDAPNADAPDVHAVAGMATPDDAAIDPATCGAPHANDARLPNFSRVARDVDALVFVAPPAHDVVLPPPPPVVAIPESHVPAGPRPQATAPPPPVRGPPPTLVRA